jgi:hypothetical protein
MPSAYVLIVCELVIIAKINAESTESLSTIIGLDIKKLDRIQSTLTLIVNEDL